MNPNLWIAANNLAFLIGEHSSAEPELERALELAKQANILRPEDPAIMDSLGWIYFKKGEIEKAREIVSLADEINHIRHILTLTVAWRQWEKKEKNREMN